jgi:hypothetical protein
MSIGPLTGPLLFIPTGRLSQVLLGLGRSRTSTVTTGGECRERRSPPVVHDSCRTTQMVEPGGIE